MGKGYVQESTGENGKTHDFAADEQVPSRFLDRLQEDDILISGALSQIHYKHHLPEIHTSDYKMSNTTSADTVTLGDNVLFTVAGVLFDTHDLASRDLTIPDSSTKYLYAEVNTDCGQLVDWGNDPQTRNLTVSLTLEDSKVDSTETKMLILKAVKAGAGTTPTVTTYENNGHSEVLGAVTAPSAAFSSEQAGRPYFNATDKLDFATGRVPLILADEELVLEITSTITKTVSGLAANTAYYAYAGKPSSGTTLAAGDIEVNTTAPTLKPAQGGKWMNAAGTKQFLGCWFTDDSSEFTAGKRIVGGWAELSSLTPSAGIDLPNAWGNILIPGTPQIDGTLVIPQVNTGTQAANFSRKGNTGNSFILVVMNNAYNIGTYGTTAVSVGSDGQLAGYDANGARKGYLWRILEPR